MSEGPDPARARFAVIVVARLGGAALAVLGLAISGGRFASVPEPAGWALLGLGLVQMTLVPRLLARRWRSPPDA